MIPLRNTARASLARRSIRRMRASSASMGRSTS
jgi:hypothetical protein